MEKYLSVLKDCPFFREMTDREILSVLPCVSARIITKRKDEYLFHAGERTSEMGLVLSGAVLVIQEDIWGRRNIMSRIDTGGFFAEPYAATPGSVLNISVIACSDCEIMMLNVSRLLTSCPSACSHHTRMIQSLVAVLAEKVLQFNEKITHMSRRTTREKILSYLSSEAVRQGKRSFDIPYDRQQLADYLCVERSAMSAELSKLQKEGLIRTTRSHFEIQPQSL